MADPKKDPPAVYFYLVSLTSLGRAQDAGVIDLDHQRVNDVVHGLHGTCALYTTNGPYDYVSEVTAEPGYDFDGTAAIKVQHEIELKGFAKAILLPGYKHDK